MDIMSKFLKGKYKPKNPEKYIGDINNIVYRSSWELSLVKWCDYNPAVKRYNMEGIVIPYVSAVDNKVHRYYVDFAVEYEDSKGKLQKALIEVKPYAQTQPPKTPKRKTKYYLNEVLTYHVNMSKWKQAVEFCRKNHMDFIVMTEKGPIKLSHGTESGNTFLTEGIAELCPDLTSSSKK